MTANSNNQYTILVVNDDGPKSPLLLPFLDSIWNASWCKELRVVVPAEEQSWVAKSISRFCALNATPHTFGKHAGYLVNGSPADCVSLGVNNLYPEFPDVVLSGINMGTNAGSAFLFSSGTVGGAIEASLYHVRGIAFSAHLPGEIFDLWRDHRVTALSEHLSQWERLAAVAVQAAGKLIPGWESNSHELLSVNIPWKAELATPLVETSLAPTHFHALFGEVGELEFRHKFQGLKTIEREQDAAVSGLPTDIHALEASQVSVTPLWFRMTGRLSAAQRSQLA